MNDPPSPQPLAVPSSSSIGAAASCSITLQNPNRYREAGARGLRPWIAPLISHLAPGAESFVVRFISDREMRRLNRDFRHKDRTTDVLTFPGDYVPGDDLPEVSMPSNDAAAADLEAMPAFMQLDHLGDVVISVPTARRQAAEREHGVHRELRLLILHGVLHCLGFDHETDDGAMERYEARLRTQFVDGGSSHG